MEDLLSICLTVDYPNRKRVLSQASLSVKPGEVLGLVGSSGCGKSTLALSILNLLDTKGVKTQGSVLFDNCELLRLKERELRKIRGKEISLVLQSPLSSLNPVLSIGTQLKEAWKAHSAASDWRSPLAEAMRNVSLPDDDEFLRRQPSQISIGQAQRVLIAMAVLHRPRLLIGDEPTSALDVITQAEILQLFKQLNRRLGMAVLYISHDLVSVASICDRIAIMYKGEILEQGSVKEIFSRPVNAYTRQLVGALPRIPECVLAEAAG